MPHKPDLPCAGDCGKLLWRGSTSLPEGEAMCRPCRAARWAGVSMQERNRTYQRESRARRANASISTRETDTCALCPTPVSARHRYCELHSAALKRERDRDKGHRRRARKYGVRYEYVSPKSVYQRDEWRCGICGEDVDKDLEYPHPMSASLDHIVPISRYGDHVLDNLQCAHLVCNLRKSNHVEGGVAA